MTASLLGSMLVYWAAHVWSDAVGERIRLGEAFRPRDVLLIARREWPLVEAAALPVDPACARMGRSMVSRDGREAGTCSGAGAGRRVGIRRGAARRRSRLTATCSPRAKECSRSVLLAAERLVH
jgi:hypothetical protein